MKPVSTRTRTRRSRRTPGADPAGEPQSRTQPQPDTANATTSPANVAIHRVATAAELGDIQVAVDLGPRVDTTGMPMERRVRHSLEVARALSAWDRTDEALETVLKAEHDAPEQVRYHVLSRQLVLSWIRRQRTKPSTTLVDLARRLDVMD
jgi:hypothetical protein